MTDLALAFAQGLAFGMVLQLSVGPVCLGVFQKSLDGRIGPALWMVVGVALADGLYIALALAGVGALLQVAALRVALGLLGALVLAWFGWRTLRAAGAATAKAASGDGAVGSLRYGLLLTLTNPLTVLFWGGVFGGLAATTFAADQSGAFVFGAGCVSATLLFLGGVAAFAQALRGFLGNPRVLAWTNRLVGVFLLGFAVRLAVGALA